MKCKNCGHENMEGANFCINCGTKIEEEKKDSEPVVLDIDKNEPVQDLILVDQSKDEPAAAEEITDLSSDQPEWYFVENKESVGPYSQTDILDFYRQGRLNDQSYVWTKGMENWVHFDQTELKNLIKNSESENTELEPECVSDVLKSSAATDYKEPENTYYDQRVKPTEWFYVDNGKSAGPYNEDAMAALIRNGVIFGDSYVWKEGMKDWEHLQDTELSAYLRAQQTQNSYSNTNMNSSRPYASPAYNTVTDHSVVLYILLTVLTCGIWYLVWVYQLARDINLLAARQQKPKGLDPVLSVILIFLSCSIFSIFFFWKEENVIAQFKARNYQVQNQSVLTGVLAVFFPVASAAIIQDQINCLIRYE